MRRALWIITVAAALLPGVTLAGPLADRVEAVVVKANTLPPELQDAPLASYRLFAWDGNALAVIPMQLDECDDKGGLIWQDGPGAGGGDGKFNGLDELVFLAADAGSSYDGSPPEGCSAAVVIKVTDLASGASAAVLLARYDSPPPLSSARYVQFDLTTRRVTTDHYRFGWEKKLAFFYDLMAVGRGPDVLDRLKIRLTMGKFGIDATFNEEEHFDFKYVGSLVGPVRAVLRSDNRYKVGPLGLIVVPQTIYFYPRHIAMLTGMDTTLNPAIIGLDFSVAIGHDLLLGQREGDYKICTNTLPQCQPYQDKLPPERIKELTEQDTVWGGFDGPDGALISYFVPDPRLPTKTHSLYVDDPNHKYPPEEFPGSLPLISFYIIDWKNAKAGLYSLDFYHFFLEKYAPEEVDRFARMIKSPLRTTVEKK